MINIPDLTTKIANEIAVRFELKGEALDEYNGIVQKYINDLGVTNEEIEALQHPASREAFQALKSEI